MTAVSVHPGRYSKCWCEPSLTSVARLLVFSFHLKIPDYQISCARVDSSPMFHFLQAGPLHTCGVVGDWIAQVSEV